MGEFGAVNKSNTSDRIKYAKYYVSSAKELGIPCFWWDNGDCAPLRDDVICNTGIMDRTTYEWAFPELTEAIVDAAK